MLHLHILSWVLAIILFIATYLNISKSRWYAIFQTITYGTTIIYAVDVNFRILDINSVIYEWRANHMLLTLKMLCGVAVVGLMEVSIAKRKET